MPFLSLCLLLLLLGSRAEAGEIIGGTESKPHSRPYMALLEITTSQNHTALCGGFLIRQNFMLTAAHCSGSSIKVTLGVHDQREKEGMWQKLKVVKQFLHPKYADFFIRHDVMLLKLKEKANLTLAVGTLPLPPQFNFMPPRRMCQAVGWGKTSVKESRSNVLQEVKLRLLDLPACQHFPGSLWGPLLCAGVAQGIASYAHKNAMPPSVFTQISYYRPWINKVLKN